MLDRLREHKPSTFHREVCRVCDGGWPCEARQALDQLEEVAVMAYAHGEGNAACENAMKYILDRCE